MAAVYKKASVTNLPFIIATAVLLLSPSAWPDIADGPLPEADVDGLLFYTTFEPETTEYSLVQRDLGNQTERVVARSLGRYKKATVSLDGKLFFFGGKLKDDDDTKIYIMTRPTADDDFEISSEITLPEDFYFTDFIYDDWRGKLYLNYFVPVKGTL